MAATTGMVADRRILRVFVSYASEDWAIAQAVAKGLGAALDDGFAEIFVDKWALETGADFKHQLETRLEQSDILIIVYTGVDKQSHGFTGWEVGFFERAMQAFPERERKVIAVYLEHPPATVSGYQGISLGVTREQMQWSVEEFGARNRVADEDPLCMLMEELQARVEQARMEAKAPRNAGHAKRDVAECVRQMRLAIFSHLKTTNRNGVEAAEANHVAQHGRGAPFARR